MSDYPVSILLALVLAPLLLGVINRTKAFFAGRAGQPVLQLYSDLWKLLHKGAVFSRTTTWTFRAGPVIGLAAVIVALLFVPFAGTRAVIYFAGDFIVVAGLLGLMRFFTVVAALDTGSSFEGMGASREVQFSALAEPALLVSLCVIARVTRFTSVTASLSDMLNYLSVLDWMNAGPELALVAAALLVVLLTENARIPIDDPNTHLELTMIHEVMVLDHSGPDFALIQYAASLKFWLLSAILVQVLYPVRCDALWETVLAGVGAMILLAVVVGVIESCMARLRLLRVPQLLVSAGVLSALAFILLLR